MVKEEKLIRVLERPDSGRPTSGIDGGGRYVVAGPESSGTKLTARLLRAAGCRSIAIVGGDDGRELPLDGHPSLLRRSMPHGPRWWSVAELLRLLPAEEVRAVVTARDWFSMAESQVARSLVPDVDAAVANIRRAYSEIFAGLAAASVPFVLSSYEAIVSKPEYVRRLLALLGLRSASVETYDGNEKWYVEGLDVEARIRRYPAVKRG